MLDSLISIDHGFSRTTTWTDFAPAAGDFLDVIDKARIAQSLPLVECEPDIADCIGFQLRTEQSAIRFEPIGVVNSSLAPLKDSQQLLVLLRSV